MNNEIDEEMTLTDDDLIDTDYENNINKSERTLREKIEMKRELLELMKITGESYDINIFD
jgi:hypothetical protein